MHICVLIPAYMEVENLERLIPLLYQEIYPQLPKVRFSTLLVDDDSADGTQKLIDRYRQRYPRLYVSYGEKRGIGAAMKRGYSYVLSHLSADAIFTLEADFVVDPRELIPMVAKLSSADVILASRHKGADSYGKDGFRRLMHFFVNTILCGYVAGMTQVREHTAACRLIRVKGIIEKINLASLPDGYTFFASQLFALSSVTDRIIEHETPFFERTKGESKVKLASLFSLIRDILNYCDLAIKIRFRK